MPQILINKNGIDLEEIERMQNEKDGNSIQEKPYSKNLKTETLQIIEHIREIRSYKQ